MYFQYFQLLELRIEFRINFDLNSTPATYYIVHCTKRKQRIFNFSRYHDHHKYDLIIIVCVFYFFIIREENPNSLFAKPLLLISYTS